jgi:hypothetical protein
MTIRIAELERSHAAILRRQGLGSARGDRSNAAASDARIGAIHVADDDRQMLEPQVRTAAVPWIGASLVSILYELNLLVPKAHREYVDHSALDTDKAGKPRIVAMLSTERFEAEDVAIEALRAVEVRDSEADSLDPYHRRRDISAMKGTEQR